MIPRRALSRLRTLLLVFGVLAIVQLGLAVSAFWQATHDEDRGFVLPGPDRVRSIVTVIDEAPASLREDFARALNDEQLEIKIVPDARNLKGSDRTGTMPGVERVLDRYLDTLGDREVIAWMSLEDATAINPPAVGPGRLWSRYPLKMAVELKRGDWLVVEARGNLAQTLFGFPPGFWAGIFGVSVAFASLWLLWRSLAPLSGLANALDRFSSHPVAQDIRPEGPDETRRIIEAVNRMQVEIAGFIAERQVTFGALSHDLRTMLTRLALRVGAIEDSEARERAEHDVFAMNAMVEDALMLARLDAAPASEGAQCELGELVHELKAAYPHTGIRVETPADVTADAIVIQADGANVFRAAQNLIENAIAYAGGFEIEVSGDAKQCRLDILDRGPGITEEDRARLVQPFTRGDDTRIIEKSGSGLGLAIAKRIAERAGGKFTLLDRDGGGLIARLELPARLCV